MVSTGASSTRPATFAVAPDALAPAQPVLASAARSAPRTALLALAAAVAALRVGALPRSFWEFDEFLFAAGIRQFDPALHHPHPPGYPLLIGLGKIFTALSLTPFQSLIAIAVLSSVLGAPALAAAIRRLAMPLGERSAWSVGIAGALLFHGSAAMLVQGSLPMSDPPALLFLALALWCCGEWMARASRRFAFGAGAAFSAAIGCRPQLAIAVLPALAVTIWLTRRGGTTWLASLGFTGTSLAWFTPLVLRLGGFEALYAYQFKHASAIAGRDLALWRHGWTNGDLLARFLSHPWGPSWIALPILCLAALGAAALVRAGLLASNQLAFETPMSRRGNALPAEIWHSLRPLGPAVTLGAVQLAFCLIAMEPADGVRYALPVAMVVAALAALGAAGLARRASRPRIALVVPALLITGSTLYTAPFLVQRATVLSPPAQALAWAHDELPSTTIFLVERGLAPHAAGLLGDRFVLPLERTLNFYPELPKRAEYMILEGVCPWGSGRTFAWQPSDAFGKLTRHHYGQISLCEVPPARRFLAENGVSPIEISPPNAWWWLADRAALSVRPRGADRVRLRLHLPPGAAIAATHLRVAAAGETIGTIDLRRGQTLEATFALPAAHRLDASLELVFAADTSFVPAETGESGDRRRLSAELLELELLPAPGAPS